MTRQGKTKTVGFLCCFFRPRRYRDEDDAERRPEGDKKTRGRDKTRTEKTKEDKTRQDETRQDKE